MKVLSSSLSLRPWYRRGELWDRLVGPVAAWPSDGAASRYRHMATHHGLGSGPDSPASRSSKRKAVTLFNDDGQVAWKSLSFREKTSRATQQTFNFALILLGVILTGGVGYYLYIGLVSPDSAVTHFNRAVNRIRSDPKCLALLGDRRQVVAYGSESTNKWKRARPISSSTYSDSQGNKHLIMQFNVEGPKGSGVVSGHLIKHVGRDSYEYKFLFLDVSGQPRVYLENSDRISSLQKSFKFFGANWRSNR